MTVPADSIVKTLNVIKHIRLGVLPGGVDVAFDSLFLQAAEERFCNRIAPTVPSPAHAGHQMVVLAPTIEIITAKLAALVGVNHHMSFGPSAPYRHRHGIQYQLCGHDGVH